MTAVIEAFEALLTSEPTAMRWIAGATAAWLLLAATARPKLGASIVLSVALSLHVNGHIKFDAMVAFAGPLASLSAALAIRLALAKARRKETPEPGSEVSTRSQGPTDIPFDP